MNEFEERIYRSFYWWIKQFLIESLILIIIKILYIQFQISINMTVKISQEYWVKLIDVFSITLFFSKRICINIPFFSRLLE